MYIQNLATIGLAVSEITCLIKVDTDTRQTDRQTETGNYLSSKEILDSLFICLLRNHRLGDSSIEICQNIRKFLKQFDHVDQGKLSEWRSTR